MKIEKPVPDKDSRANKHAEKSISDSKSKSKKGFKNTILFWRKPKEETDELDSFSTKRDKEKAKRRNKIVMGFVLFLMVGGSLSSIGVNLLSRINFGSDKSVPASALTDTSNDLAAKKILDGKAVSVSDKATTDSSTKDSTEELTVEEAVKRQKESDQKEIDKLKAEYEAFKKKTEEDLAKATTDEEEINKLKSQVDELTKANEDLIEKQVSNDKSVSDSKTALDKAKAETSSATAKNSEYEKQISDLEKQIKDLKADVAEKQDLLDRAQIKVP